jgi:hypothetical protein
LVQVAAFAPERPSGHPFRRLAEGHADGIAWARSAVVLGLIAATWLLVCVRGKLPPAPTTMQPLAMTLMAWLAVDNFFVHEGIGTDADDEYHRSASWAIANATPIAIASALCVLWRTSQGVVCFFDVSPRAVPKTKDWLLIGVAILAIEAIVPNECLTLGLH